MINLLGRLRDVLKRQAVRFAIAMLLALGLASHPVASLAATYVSADLGDVKPEDKAKVDNPQPVQLLFQFETKGAPNAAATKFLKAKVTEIVTNSGLFSSVSEEPVPNGAVLSVVIDNVVTPEEMSDATAQGVKTGATLFIAGSNITDHYVATIEYVSGPGAAKITRTAKHALITQMGMINKPPENAVKIGSMKDGVFVMATQIILNPLNEIAKDPAFAGGEPAAPAAAAPVEAAPAEAAASVAVPPADAAPVEPAPAEPATAPPAEPAPTDPAAPKA